MKVKPVIAVAILALSVSGLAVAKPVSSDSYTPPERLTCSNVNGKVSCEGFSRQYLVEDSYIADFKGSDVAFVFVSGAAYYNSDKSEADIFFSYRNSDGKTVKLKTVNFNMRPDLVDGSWLQVQDDLYVCTEGYMSCPIVSADSISKHN